jgi:hypothetical protein
MSFTYLRFLITLTQSCICGGLAYAIGPANAYCLGYQISEQANIVFEETMRQDRLPLNMSLASEPMLLPAYIEDCRMKLWEQAFNTYFKGHDSFKKADDFVGFNGTDLLVRRVLFRYVSNLIDFNNCFNSSYLSCYFKNSKM